MAGFSLHSPNSAAATTTWNPSKVPIYSGIERGACRARGLWLCCIMHLSRMPIKRETGNSPDRQDPCHRRAGHCIGKATDRLLDHYLGRFNAGARCSAQNFRGSVRKPEQAARYEGTGGAIATAKRRRCRVSRAITCP
jgi:hypothetical protein